MKKVCLILVLVLAVVLTASATVWQVSRDYDTIQDAIDSDSVMPGDKIIVEPGNHAGAKVTKAVEIKGMEGATITSGPMYHPTPATYFGFYILENGSGATISHLQFSVDVGLSIYGNGANDVSVSQCTFISPVQAISNWGGSRWNIDHNEIIDLRCQNGGGIGIFIGERTGKSIYDNVVAHNKISGALHIWETEKPGYSGAGIVLYVDFRNDRPGAIEVAWNRIIKNKVSLISDNPDIVEINGITLTQGRTPPRPEPEEEEIVISSNAIGFNDFRGTAVSIVLIPITLEAENKISRNLGDNRGHGLHPRLFLKPILHN